MKFWNWLKDRLSITTTNDRLTSIEGHMLTMGNELAKLRKKVVRKPSTYGQIERHRSRERHPARH